MLAADAVYISHSHSDHLNWPTLRALAERADVSGAELPLLYVADLEEPVCSPLLAWVEAAAKLAPICPPACASYLHRQAELAEQWLARVRTVPLGSWQALGPHGRFMILADAVFPLLDTCLIVEYKVRPHAAGLSRLSPV